MSLFTSIASWWAGARQWYRDRKSHGAGKVLLNKYFLATIAFLVIICFIDTNNVGVYFRTQKELKDQQKQIEAYEESIRVTEDKLTSLQSKKDSLERFAREEYYYCEDGEDVYVVE